MSKKILDYLLLTGQRGSPRSLAIREAYCQIEFDIPETLRAMKGYFALPDELGEPTLSDRLIGVLDQEALYYRFTK